MIRVLLIHGGIIPHYRVPVYGYLKTYLGRTGFDLMVASNGIQNDSPHASEFPHYQGRLSISSIARLIYRHRIDVIILFVDMRHLYLFPTYGIAKGLGRKVVWWGQGRDLSQRDARIKNLAYATEHALCDSIIVYAEHLKKYISQRFHKKVFVANNTLCVTGDSSAPTETRESVLSRYGIQTRKNIICVGRLQRRKRLEHLVAALDSMKRPDIGLILVGPDPDGVVGELKGSNIYRLGPLYGLDKVNVLWAADVYCLPGAVGLSIVDAFQCGLPLVTEDGDESAEIAYLRSGENGFVVPRGDIAEMAGKLLLLLDNDELRKRFGDAARREIAERGHIDLLCAGFKDALCYAVGSDRLSKIS